MIRALDLVRAAAEPQNNTARAFAQLVMSVPHATGAVGFKERVIDGVHFGFARYASAADESPLDCVFAIRVPKSALVNEVYLAVYGPAHDAVAVDLRGNRKHRLSANSANELLHALVKLVLADVRRVDNRTVQGAAEPRSGDWRWIQLYPPAQTEAMMRRIQLRCVQKRLAPVMRYTFPTAGPQKQVSYALLFRDTASRRRYIMNLYGVAKKLGATPEMLETLDPRKLDQRYVSTMCVAPGSVVWKFLVKYGFQTEQATAAAEPKVTQELSRAFSVLLEKFKTSRTTTIQGHAVKIACGDDELDDMLFLQTTSPDGEEHEVWACDVELNGKIAIEVAVPDRERSGPGPGGAHLKYIHHAAGPEDLLQQLVRYLVHSYKAVYAAAEPQHTLNIEKLDRAFSGLSGSVYATAPSKDYPRTRRYEAVIGPTMVEDRKPIWSRPTLILVTQLRCVDKQLDLTSLRGTTPHHAYFDPETHELVVLGVVGSVNPKEIGRKHVTDARAAVKYILQCIVKNDDPLKSWR